MWHFNIVSLPLYCHVGHVSLWCCIVDQQKFNNTEDVVFGTKDVKFLTFYQFFFAFYWVNQNKSNLESDYKVQESLS